MMLSFTITDGVILLIFALIIGAIVYKMIKDHKAGSCSSCSVYKKAKQGENGLKAYYKKMKNNE